jgi:triosephosphate isomerase
MNSRKKIIVGAWKAYLKLDDVIQLSTRLAKWRKEQSSSNDYLDLVLAPSMTYLYSTECIIKDVDIILSAQDVDPVNMGAHTGHIPPEMLLDVGCKYVLLGHSEKRYSAEYEVSLPTKVEYALKSGLHVILCVGETRAEKDNNKTFEKLRTQIISVLSHIPKDLIKNCFDVAYEPVWAISSQNPVEPPTAADVRKISEFIRQTLNEELGIDVADTIRILYGGSVNTDNVCDYLNQSLIDGVLVGSASTKLPGFIDLLDRIESNKE